MASLTGVFTLLDLTVPVAVQIFGSVQALWWLAAAGTLLMRAQKPFTARPASDVAATGHTTAGRL